MVVVHNDLRQTIKTTTMEKLIIELELTLRKSVPDQ